MIEVIESVGATGLRLAAPLLLAALGELFAERSGVLNLGIEGMMLMGAISGFWITFITESLFLGVLAAVMVGGLMGLLMAFLSISLRANQIVAGLALWIFGLGLSGFIYRSGIWGPYVYPTVSTFGDIAIPGLSGIPALGPILFNQSVLVYLSLIAVPICFFLLFKTTWGLKVTAVGENPRAADTLGIKVFHTRYICVIIGGILAGVAGAFLPLVWMGSFNENMTAGRGFIAFALVIFGAWKPWRILAGSVLFGSIDAVQMRLQASGGVWIYSYQFLLMLPYILTIVALVILSRRAGAPAALTKPYVRGAE